MRGSQLRGPGRNRGSHSGWPQPNAVRLFGQRRAMFRLSQIFISGLVAGVLGCVVSANASAQTASEDPANTSSRRPHERSETQPGTKPLISALRPNIILINLDDADMDLFKDQILDAYLPNIKRLATEGLTLTNCHVVTPLCGPSRTCLLRGQYAHRTGIKTNLAIGPMNNGFTGAYERFKELGYEQEHLGVWMQRAGYRTMMIGKYLHGRMNPVDIPGWDDLHICFGGNYFATSLYSKRLPVPERRHATGESQYRTVVEADEAVQMIEQHSRNDAQTVSGNSRQPFFLYLAPLAPHKPAGQTAMLQTEYENLGKEIRLTETPDLNEADISDKPAHLQVAKLDDKVMASLHEEYRLRVMATKSVDDLLGRLRNTLERTGDAERTYIFLTSDHGYQLGHNRMIAKKVPYHRNTVVPTFVIGPGINPGKTDHLLAQIDLVPTFLELAGGTAPVTMDGKSWVSLLKDPDAIKPDGFRDSLLIQNWEEKSQLGNLIPASYASLRLNHRIFTEWSNGQVEYYDLAVDPFQVENQIGSLSKEQRAEFSRRLHQLKQGAPEPVVTFACPELISKNTPIRGLAEHDQAVAAVEVSIRDPQHDLYWTGKSWRSGYSTVDAELANPNGLITDWHEYVDLSGIEDNGSIAVVARARDQQGHFSEPKTVTFRVDAIEPETVLKLPANGSIVQSPVTLFGTCGDNQEMRGVELVLENVERQTFWDGVEWVPRESTFFKRVAQERWHTTLVIPVGQYRATARSLDQAGNYDGTPSVTEFSVK